MKKFLSLVLALVMTMSLVTVSAGAKDFDDNDAITYEEAVAVMSEVGVVDGYTDGSFKPTTPLNRGQAAKIICNLILGPTTAAALRADTAPFKDVPVDHTFAGYIAYCSQQGIITGYADGAFRPTAPLTGYAFMKMLLGALGYDAAVEGYVGPNWSVQVAKRALGIGLNAGLAGDFNGVDTITREEACLYALNTLQATMVEYDAKTTVSVGGSEVVIAGSSCKNVAQTGYKNTMNADNLQFAEKYFSKLSKDATTDAFGRPAYTWVYAKEDIGTYVDYTTMVSEYTTAVSGKDLYNDLSNSVLKDYTFNIFVDGETEKAVLGGAYFTEGKILKTNTENVGSTGNGVLTQVFVNNDTEVVTIAVINTYLAFADDDYNEKKDNVVLTVEGITDAGHSRYVKAADEQALTVKGDDFAIEDVAEDDGFLVTVAEGAIQTMDAVEVEENVSINKFKTDSYVVAEGEQYDYADAAYYDPAVLDQYNKTNMKETTYNVYLDSYGYLLGIDIVEKPTNYVFLTGMNDGYSNYAGKTADAAVIFVDGKTEVIEVNTAKSTLPAANSCMNTWCTYTVDKNGVYTLTQVGKDAAADGEAQFRTWVAAPSGTKEAATINKKHVSLDGTGVSGYTKVYGNDDTNYITVSTDLIVDKANGKKAVIIDDVDSVTTGVQNVDLVAYSWKTVCDSYPAADIAGVKNGSHGVYTLYGDNGYVIAAIVVGEDQGATSNYAYITSKTVNYEGWDKDGEAYTWTRNAIVNGEEVELVETSDALSEIGHKAGEGAMGINEWWEIRFNADGTVRRADKVDFTVTGDKFLIDTADYQNQVDKFDNMLMFENLTTHTYDLTFAGNTFFTDTATQRGFAVSSSVKVILIQDSVKHSGGTVKVMDDITTYTSVKTALNRLNDNHAFKGYVSAVFEGGVATQIVIYDQTATVIEDGDNTINGDIIVRVDGSYVYSSRPANASLLDEADAIVAYMEDLGYTDVETQIGSNAVQKVFATKGKNNFEFDVNPGGAPIAVAANDADLAAALTSSTVEDIYLTAGTFTVGNTITGDKTIIGDGAETVIEGANAFSGGPSVLVVDAAAKLVVENVTIKGTGLSDNGIVVGPTDGATRSAVEIVNCVFEDVGVAIHLNGETTDSGAAVLIKDCTFNNEGNAIKVDYNVDVTIDNCTFNTDDIWPDIACWNQTYKDNTTVTNCAKYWIKWSYESGNNSLQEKVGY